jgi:prepilin-type processing-associated H-X9-DG protein
MRAAGVAAAAGADRDGAAVRAIITILAAILFPVFAQAREKARSTQCLSNLKQVGMATRMYSRGNVHFRHSEGFNAVFVDGHAKWTRRTSADMWARDPKTMRRDTPRGTPCWPFFPPGL